MSVTQMVVTENEPERISIQCGYTKSTLFSDVGYPNGCLLKMSLRGFLFNVVLRNGIWPYINLNHYDLPQALQHRCKRRLSRQRKSASESHLEFSHK